ncbi:ATP-binding protein [Chachezhania antarctica]|uniref:ATP-binding protein n=1 Tax=Chachezhania antarctica TaxID=2340860 RepID=UPI000EAD8CC1|nr:ATP-binding protein [Chachezhania antarctica]|tara:strand:- start:4245 stop:4715 length:471 start_codon:yes stop_codon:yes gene_type:complete
MTATGRILEFDFAATDVATRRALAGLTHRLPELEIGPDMGGCIEIVLAEALNNVVEHAYAARPGGKIRVRLRRTRSHLVVTIRDTGRPFPGKRLPPFVELDLSGSLDSLPEGGFGWSLIRDLTGAVRYRHISGVNVLYLRMDLDPANAPCRKTMFG